MSSINLSPFAPTDTVGSDLGIFRLLLFRNLGSFFFRVRWLSEYNLDRRTCFREYFSKKYCLIYKSAVANIQVKKPQKNLRAYTYCYILIKISSLAATVTYHRLLNYYQQFNIVKTTSNIFSLFWNDLSIKQIL